MLIASHRSESASKPPFAFISDFRGKEIPDPWQGAKFRPIETRDCTYYGLSGPVSIIRRAARDEATALGWKIENTCKAGATTYLQPGPPEDYDKRTSYEVNWGYSDLPESYSCVVTIRKRHSWLKRTLSAFQSQRLEVITGQSEGDIARY